MTLSRFQESLVGLLYLHLYSDALAAAVPALLDIFVAAFFIWFGWNRTERKLTRFF